MPDPGPGPLPRAAQEEVPGRGVRQAEGSAQERLLQPAGPRGPLRPGAEERGLRVNCTHTEASCR
ncbi:hypothetical protein MUK42_29499 [Musa troglodytarum]|uniref:Uncharacterized protein n=1 Tax=Musa troglodytarum TaxID=320322 RepID=A0A9E7FH01_9LILI|nr:hypothetical protein MUK42_29499 [Musa troglodytarum]